MLVTDRRAIAGTGLEATIYGFGSGTLGNRGRVLSEATGRDLVSKAWDAGIRYFDTAPMYGHGLAENRLGTALRSRRREDFVLSTKVGRLLKPAHGRSFDSGLWMDVPSFEVVYDYSYDGTLRSIEDSLQRMLTDRIDIAFIHDCDHWTHGADWRDKFEEAMTGAYRALARLKDEGVIGAIGMGVNDADVCLEATKRARFDVFLLAREYTLLGQEPLDNLFPACTATNTSIIQGGAFHSGILATGPRPGATFGFSEAPEPILRKVGLIEDVCRKHRIPLPAAALQFSAAHPAVASVLVGSSSVEQQARNVALMQMPIPQQLWQDLRRAGLIRPDAPIPVPIP
jgi:D-threo-aldose 1-dehydrogenase